jgi:hypothetical protein
MNEYTDTTSSFLVWNIIVNWMEKFSHYIRILSLLDTYPISLPTYVLKMCPYLKPYNEE